MLVTDTPINSMGGYLYTIITFVLVLQVLIFGKNNTSNSGELIGIETPTKLGNIVAQRIDWQSVIIDGSFIAFVAMFTAVGGVLINRCGPAISDYFNLTTNSYEGDNEKAYYTALVAYTVLLWVGIIFFFYGKGREWIFTNRSYRA